MNYKGWWNWIEKHILWSSNSSSLERANLNNLQPPSLLSLAQQVKAPRSTAGSTGAISVPRRWWKRDGLGWTDDADGRIWMCEGNKSIACWERYIFTYFGSSECQSICHSPVEPHWMKMCGVWETGLGAMHVKSFKGEIIHSFSQCLLSTYYMPDTSLGTG